MPTFRIRADIMVDDLSIVPERDEPTAKRKPTKDSARPSAPRRAAPPPKSGGSSALVSVLCFMVVLISGAAAYLYLQVQTLNDQRSALDARLKDVEDTLSVTGESLSESGAAMQVVIREQGEMLTLHTSEIDKLWGVAYRTNRPKLDALEKAQGSQADTVKALSASVAKIEPVVENMSDLSSQVRTTSNQSLALSANLDELEASVRGLTDRMSGLQRDVQSQTASNNDHSAAIEAIDQYRVQINQRLLQLENQVRGGQ